MSKSLKSTLAALTLPASATALAWPDPGVNEPCTPPRAQVLLFKQEMRDLSSSP